MAITRANARSQLGIDTDVWNQFAEMRPHLPKRVESILDIGCGPAKIDMLLAKHYGSPLQIHLIDGDGTTEARVGYRIEVKAWNDRLLAVEEVKKVGIGFAITGWPPDPELTIKADLIISLKSWCHHYPAQYYLPLVQRSLKLGGKIITDIRNKTDGLEVLTAGGFTPIVKIGQSRKCERWLLQ